MAAMSPAQGRKLLESGDHSDFLITCHGREIKCHRAILATMSGFFAALLKHGFKECKDGKVDLPDDDPDTIYRLCEFIYTGRYTVHIPTPASIPLPESPTACGQDKETERKVAVDEQTGDTVSKEQLLLEKAHALVYIHAAKYSIASLKDMAYAKFDLETGYGKFHWDASFVALVLENTDRDDTKLRSFVLRKCFDCHGSTLQNLWLTEVLAQHEPVLHDVGERMRDELYWAEKNVERSKPRIDHLSKMLDDARKESNDYMRKYRTGKEQANKDRAEARKNLLASIEQTHSEIAYARKLFATDTQRTLLRALR